MKKILTIILCGLPFLLPAQHLLFNEVVLQPSAGEYVEIINPTGSTVNLSDYYITDATDSANGKYYYNLPADTDYWSGSGSDFIARFPDRGIPAGESIILGLGRTSDYSAEYGVDPDLSLKDDMLDAVSGSTTIGGSPNAKLDNSEEVLILFHWDGVSSTVSDVDYLLWGSDFCAVDKSGESGYSPDTPKASQALMPVHLDGEKVVRVSASEGSEPQSGGNGIDGDNETGENLNITWAVQTLSSSKPVISNVSLAPASPLVDDTLNVTATVMDDQGGLTVECVYNFESVETAVSMTNTAGDDYSCRIDPMNAEGTFSYYVRASNSGALSDSSIIYSADISEPEDVLTIKDVRDDFETYYGETVTVSGYVTVELGSISPYSGYMQDNSGRGINVYGSALGSYERGRHISVTGEITEYNDIIEISASNIQDLGAGSIPDPLELTCAQINSNFTEYEGTLIKVSGMVTNRTDYETASNVFIDDGSGSTTLRIWASTGVLDDASVDSLLNSGNSVNIAGICSFYSGNAQILPAYPEDVTEYVEGTPGTEEFGLTVAAYPFAPKRGEVINYSYEYPSDVRVTLRVYDAAGRHVTTLVDKYHGMSWRYEGQWNGKNELNSYVRPGVYFMHLEIIERTTGQRISDVKPVVVAVKQ